MCMERGGRLMKKWHVEVREEHYTMYTINADNIAEIIYKFEHNKLPKPDGFDIIEPRQIVDCRLLIGEEAES